MGALAFKMENTESETDTETVSLTHVEPVQRRLEKNSIMCQSLKEAFRDLYGC